MTKRDPSSGGPSSSSGSVRAYSRSGALLALLVQALLVRDANSAGGTDYLSDYTPSCYNAKPMHSESAEFCWMITWPTGNLYKTSTYTTYDPGTPLSIQEEDDVARNISATILGDSSSSKACRSAVRRFACLASFPYCPLRSTSLSSTSHLPPCRLQCEQVGEICGEVQADCGLYQADRSCLLNVPEGRILMDPAQGPYDDLAVFYSIMTAAWSLIAVVYSGLACCVYHDSGMQVFKLLSIVPLLKTVVMGVSILFWTDCTQNGNMCSRLIITPLFSMHHIAESGQMFVFLACSRGWCITRSFLPPDTWRYLFCLIFAFYLVTSIINTVNLEAPSSAWIIYITTVYGSMYGMMLHFAAREMAVLDAQVNKLSPHMAAAAAQPLQQKHAAFRAMLGLFFFLVGLEGVSLYLFASRATPFWVLALAYEIPHLLAVCVVLVFYRPHEVSPFFYMLPTSLEGGGDTREGEDLDQRHESTLRPTPIVQIFLSGRARGAEGDVELMEQAYTGGDDIDLTPLLAAAGQEASEDLMEAVRSGDLRQETDGLLGEVRERGRLTVRGGGGGNRGGAGDRGGSGVGGDCTRMLAVCSPDDSVTLAVQRAPAQTVETRQGRGLLMSVFRRSAWRGSAVVLPGN